MNKLRILLFGGGNVEFVEPTQQEKLTATTRFLLAYLVFYRQRPHPRDILLNLLWGDLPPERARSCLNTALWRLRRHLEPEGIPAGTYLVSTPAGEVCFNGRSDFWLDVAAFEQTVQETLHCPPGQAPEPQAQKLEDAISLYTGDLLESCSCEWVLPERERLRNLLIDAHYFLMEYYHNRRDFHSALEHGAQILANNPLREDVHRQMMRLYHDSGQRSMAARQYQACRQVLRAELNIEPMLETQLLLEQIMSAAGPAAVSPDCTQQVEIHQAMARVQLALDAVNHARSDLELVLSRLQSIG